jgi:isopenicillin-N epimerase
LINDAPPFADSPGYGAALRDEFLLAPDIAFLNHGAFGAAPRPVLAAAEEWRRRIERNPTFFMGRELGRALREAAETLAAYLNVRGDDLVFIDNATSGCNTVLRSLDFAAGDEILLTSYGYGAVAKTARYVAGRSGARIVEAPIPFPLVEPLSILEAVEARLGPRTRLAIFDHVASDSAQILPVAALAALCRGRGVPVLIDGAHAAGLIPLDIAAIEADWYVGNCHKWLMAPRGAAYLWARPERQAVLHPLTISHGYGEGFLAEFDWTGTRDPSNWLAVSAGIAFHRRLGGARLMARNDALAREAGQRLARRWGSVLGGPAAGFAAMVTVRLPAAWGASPARAQSLRAFLQDEHRIEAPINMVAGALWVRIAAQAYNALADYERLAAALAR